MDAARSTSLTEMDTMARALVAAGRVHMRTDMSYWTNEEKSTFSSRRRERLRHLLRSVGVELDGGGRVPFFVEAEPGRFRRNPSLTGIEVDDARLLTLRVPTNMPAKVPPEGLPTAVLKQLIEIGALGRDDL